MNHCYGILSALSSLAGDVDVQGLADSISSVAHENHDPPGVEAKFEHPMLGFADLHWLLSELYGIPTPHQLAAYVWATTGGWRMPHETSVKEWCVASINVATWAICQVCVDKKPPGDNPHKQQFQAGLQAAKDKLYNHHAGHTATGAAPVGSADSSGSPHIQEQMAYRRPFQGCDQATVFQDLLEIESEDEAIQTSWATFVAVCEAARAFTHPMKPDEYYSPRTLMRGVAVTADADWAGSATRDKYVRHAPANYGMIKGLGVYYVKKSLYEDYLSILRLDRVPATDPIHQGISPEHWVLVRPAPVPEWIEGRLSEWCHNLWDTWGDLVAVHHWGQMDGGETGERDISPRMVRLMSLAGIFPPLPYGLIEPKGQSS